MTIALRSITTKSEKHSAEDSDERHRFEQEHQSDRPTTYDATYTYGGLRPHAPTEIDETAPQGNKTTVFQRGLSYDENGNQAGWLFAANQRRQMSWNEENRIQLVTSNNVELARALYNGDGERAVNWQQDNPWYEIAYSAPTSHSAMARTRRGMSSSAI